MNTAKWTSLGICLSTLIAAACGDDAPAGGDYSSVANAVTHPTGELKANNAKAIAEEFEKIGTSSVGGEQQGQYETSIECPGSGSINVSSEGSGQSGHAVFSYDHCCYTTASCCFDGGGDLYYALEQGAAFSYCAEYQVDYSCDPVVGSANYSGCLSSSGEWTYSITIESKTFAVRGNFSNGTGTLTIQDANDTWTCTYSDYSGSCTGGSHDLTF